MIDFPSSPNVSQVCSTSKGNYVWTGSTWMFAENKIWLKSAVSPGDWWAADAAMPAPVTTATEKAIRLTYCGFYPAAGFTDYWEPGSFMTYDGASYHWAGSIWRNGVAPNRANLAPGGIASTWCDFSRLPDAGRVTAMGRIFTANPATAWTAGQVAGISVTIAGLSSGAHHSVSWNGTAWEFASTAPTFTGSTPWSKVMTPGATGTAEPTITAMDPTNAARLTSLGYTMFPAWTTSYGSYGGIAFPDLTTPQTVHFFYWNGSAWTAGSSATNWIYPFNVQVHAGIAALTPSQRGWGTGVYATAGCHDKWTPGTYTTVGGSTVYAGQATSFWHNGSSPGTVPPTPTKTDIVPGDIYTSYQSGMPAPANLTSTALTTVMPYAVTGAGYRPASAERMPWRSATKKLRYVNFDMSWTGSHWLNGIQGTTKTTLTPTSSPMVSSMQSVGLILGLVPDADRVAAMDAYYVASPLTAWGADEHVWVGGCIMTWNGTTWVQKNKAVTIHEAATIVASPGNVYVDSRVTAQNSTIAGQLLGWGYVPLFRNAAGGGWKGDTSTANSVANIYFWDPTVLTLGGNYAYYWNGTAWTAGTAPSATVVAPGAVVNNADIGLLPTNEMVTACTAFGYTSNTGAAWTTGQSAQIGGIVCHWHGTSLRRYWVLGAAP